MNDLYIGIFYIIELQLIILMKNMMNKISQLEDFSNEIILEIFDYLYALDIFMAFSSLNYVLLSQKLIVVIKLKFFLLISLIMLIKWFHSLFQINFVIFHLSFLSFSIGIHFLIFGRANFIQFVHHQNYIASFTNWKILRNLGCSL